MGSFDYVDDSYIQSEIGSNYVNPLAGKTLIPYSVQILLIITPPMEWHRMTGIP